MSERKLYLIRSRSDDETYFCGNRLIPNWSDKAITLCGSYEIAKEIAEENNGQPVTFVEEPEKETVSENVGKAIDSLISADTYAQASEAFRYLFVSRKKEDLKRIMKAVRNGYTVKKKKYRVLAPKSWWQSEDKPKYMHRTFGISAYRGAGEDSVFTQKQLDLYELNGALFTKEEVTDDDEQVKY